jgi:hypothetical protein
MIFSGGSIIDMIGLSIKKNKLAAAAELMPICENDSQRIARIQILF